MQALILAGGSGTRFWPASRRLRPKQLLALEGDRSLLEATITRLHPLVSPAGVWVSTTAELAAALERQIPEVAPSRVLIEPVGRNTAPAIGWALWQMPVPVRSEVIAVLPSDHRVADSEAFRAALAAAAEVAEARDCVVALGVTPRRAETGFGYLELGEALAGPPGLRRVARFTEKPDRANAERFFASGSHLWNAGIFVFPGATLLRHLERLSPEVGEGLSHLAAAPGRADQLYPLLPAISIDYAVMERLDDLVALPLDCGWDDLGSWEALWGVLPRDQSGNARRGESLAIEAEGNLLWSDEGTLAVFGVDDLIIVRSGDCVLVVPRSRAQEVRRIVERLAADGRRELL